MKTEKIWLILFVILLSINIVIGSIYVISNKNARSLEKETQIESLKEDLNKRTKDYLENAKELKFLLETMLENSEKLKEYMPEYKDVDVETFKEKLRQKVVRLSILIEELDKQ